MKCWIFALFGVVFGKTTKLQKCRGVILTPGTQSPSARRFFGGIPVENDTPRADFALFLAEACVLIRTIAVLRELNHAVARPIRRA